MPLAEKGVRGKGQPLSPPQHTETRSAMSAPRRRLTLTNKSTPVNPDQAVGRGADGLPMSVIENLPEPLELRTRQQPGVHRESCGRCPAR